MLANSFGLPAGVSCPGMTKACEAVCYAKKTENVFRAAGRLVTANWDVLQECGDDVDAIERLLMAMMTDFETDVLRLSARTSVPAIDLSKFRIHWDGDFYSEAYAVAWSRVMAEFPAIQFWAYTRTFEVVEWLVDVPNLSLYLSVDEFNAELAGQYVNKYPSLKTAVLSTTHAEASIVTVDLHGSKAPKCPENVGRIPLVMPLSGRRTETINVGDNAQGACTACGLCVNGTTNVTFATSGK